MNNILPMLAHASKRGQGATSAAVAPGPRSAARAKTGGRGGSLGTNAKSIHKPTGELFDPMALRVERFALQSISRLILPESRTAKCLRWRAHKQDVKVWKANEHKTAHYSGLQTCASVWACPVCAAKIAERRRAEVLGAMFVHEASGGNVNLLTLTVPHGRGDNLVQLLELQAKALQKFWNDRETKAVMGEMGYTGQIRAVEVTHGLRSANNNGWHPHYHILLFTGSGVELTKFGKAEMRDWEVRLYLRWAKACEGVGLGVPSMAHGLKLDNGTKAAAYATKWGLEDEMTKGHTKKGKVGGMTPFDLLRSVLADKGDKQAWALFAEFALAFKGKRQLVWSRDLKARLGVAEASDEEVAERVEEEAVLLGQLTPEQWRDVLKADARSTVLEIAARLTWYEVSRFLYVIEGAHQVTNFDKSIAAEARSIILGL